MSANRGNGRLIRERLNPGCGKSAGEWIARARTRPRYTPFPKNQEPMAVLMRLPYPPPATSAASAPWEECPDRARHSGTRLPRP